MLTRRGYYRREIKRKTAMVKEAFTEVKGIGRIRTHLLVEKWKKRYWELKKEAED